MSWSTIFNTVYGGEEQNDQERRHHGKLGPSLQYHTKEQVSLVSQYPNYAKMYKHPDLDCIKITNNHLLHQACDSSGWRLVVVGLSGNCSRNKLERAVCDRDTSVVRDRDRFTLGREERVVQAMALSVNGVCGNGDGNGEGQSVVWDLEVYMLKVQSNSCFSQGSIYLCCDTVLFVYKNVFV